MTKLSKKQIRKLARVRHHKGRAGRSRHPFYFTDGVTIPELKKEMRVV